MSRTVLFNANVITMDPLNPYGEIVVVDGDRIVSVERRGAFAGLRECGGTLVDCRGMTLAPGFIDAHCHLFGYAESLVSLALSPAAGALSIPDIQRMVRGRSKEMPAGTWIRGKGYNEFYLAEKRHPCRWDLDAAAPLHPVKLTHRSGHAHVLNSLALEKTGITSETGDPPEGLIDRNLQTGEPTGVLFGMGQYLAERAPFLEDDELENGVKLANDKLLSCGITSIQDASSANDGRRLRRIEFWKSRGILKPRISMMLGLKAFLESGRQANSAGDENIRTAGVKIIADQITGSLHPGQEELNAIVEKIDRAGYQAAIHAIEEPVIEAACKAIEYALNRRPRPDHRHRIEHCSLCPPDLLKRLKEAGAFVVTQPSFIYGSGDRYLEKVPEDDWQHLYPIGSMQAAGLQVCFSSDFPIADPNPLIGIQAAVDRRSERGAAISPQQGISLLQAWNLYTAGAASANFEEGVKGSLTSGKLADIIALNRNPFCRKSESLRDIQVMMTMIGGQAVWDPSGIFI